ncbi:MAG: hypothetical protein QOE35_2313 [Actinomycetota bacterium]
MCNRPGPAPCAACIDELEPPPRRPPPRGVDRLAVPFAYVGAGRELVARLKYRNARGAVPWLAAAMASRVEAVGLDIVTWIPTTTRRRRNRGFDQAEVLARSVARHLGLPCGALLRRLPGPAQTGRVLEQRRAGPQLTASGPVPSAVLLVDDVVTSGATITAAALTLRTAGATRVDALTAASTPLKLPRTVAEAKINATGTRRYTPSR